MVGVGEFVCMQVIVALPASYRSLIEISRHFSSLFYIKRINIQGPISVKQAS